MANISLEIGDFLGYCDLNGIEALDTEKVQQLEEIITNCNEAHNNGKDIITDAIWDRLMEILRKVNPESELCQHIWEDSVDELTDTDDIFRKNPMYSIQTVKSFDCDEIINYVRRLPDGDFDAHLSVKLNGHGIRLKYQNGEFLEARSRARASAGRDLTPQLSVITKRDGTYSIDDIAGFDLCEVRGEWVMPFENMSSARSYNPDIISPFTAVSSMGRASASEDEWNLLHFVAYEFIADGMSFPSKEEEYNFLEELGFETPLYWVIEGLNKETLIEDLKSIISDCESQVKPSEFGDGYDYYTDGIVFTINDSSVFSSLGDDGGHYKFGNMALKVGYWEQDKYSGYVQTIVWRKGKTKLSPVAIVADEPDVIEFVDGEDHLYVTDMKEIANYNDLGVVTASGNKVRRIPLYEPCNLVCLDAYPGCLIFFRYGGEAGVVPCFEDGTPLVDGRIREDLTDDYEYDYMEVTL